MKIITKYDNNSNRVIATLNEGTTILHAGKHLVKMDQSLYSLDDKILCSDNDREALCRASEDIENYVFYCLDDNVLTTIEGWRSDFRILSATITLENKD